MKNRNNRTNKFVQELNEQYKDCPVQVNTYEVDGRRYRVHSHFIGDKDIKDGVAMMREVQE